MLHTAVLRGFHLKLPMLHHNRVDAGFTWPLRTLRHSSSGTATDSFTA